MIKRNDSGHDKGTWIERIQEDGDKVLVAYRINTRLPFRSTFSMLSLLRAIFTVDSNARDSLLMVEWEQMYSPNFPSGSKENQLSRTDSAIVAITSVW